MVEAFCVYGWKTCVLDVLLCPKSKYGVCQAGFRTIITVIVNSKIAATEMTKMY